MEQKIFTNVVLVNRSKEEVHQFLLKPQSLLKWVPEIEITEQTNESFVLKRTAPAPNEREQIQIINSGNEVTYISTQGKITYQIKFTIISQDGKSLIEESLYLDDRVAHKLPLKLLTPIAKNAFNHNLVTLGQVLSDRE